MQYTDVVNFPIHSLHKNSYIAKTYLNWLKTSTDTRDSKQEMIKLKYGQDRFQIHEFGHLK